MVEHCKAAFALMGADEKLEAAKRILAWIKKPGPEPLREFTARDCWQGVRGSFEHMAEVQAGLEILEDRAFIAELTRDSSGPGRPSRFYQVNPGILGAGK
jgi:putative DNA primase/helicase